MCYYEMNYHYCYPCCCCSRCAGCWKCSPWLSSPIVIPTATITTTHPTSYTITWTDVPTSLSKKRSKNLNGSSCPQAIDWLEALLIILHLSMKNKIAQFLITLADQLDAEGKPALADEIDNDFESFLKLLEDGKLEFNNIFYGGVRDPRGPYSNKGREKSIFSIPGPQ